METEKTNFTRVMVALFWAVAGGLFASYANGHEWGVALVALGVIVFAAALAFIAWMSFQD